MLKMSSTSWLGVLGVLLAVGSVYPQCCTPDQWQGNELVLAGLVQQGKPQVVHSTSNISYDFTNKRMFIFTAVRVEGGASRMILDLKLYQKNVEYTLDLESNKCTKTALEGDMPRQCVPSFAHYESDLYFGSAQLMAKSYGFEFHAADTSLSGTVVMSSQDCLPITQDQHGTVNGVPTIQAAEFFNITSGIADPGVFNIPEPCQTASLQTGKPLASQGPLSDSKSFIGSQPMF